MAGWTPNCSLASRIAGTQNQTRSTSQPSRRSPDGTWPLSKHLLDRWDRRTDGIGTAVAQWQARDDIVNHTHGQWKPSRELGADRPSTLTRAALARRMHRPLGSPRTFLGRRDRRRGSESAAVAGPQPQLIAYVEEERTRLEKIIRATVSDDDLELLADGGARLHRDRFPPLAGLPNRDRPRRRRLPAPQGFRSLRNDLAHRTPVPDTRLSQIRAYLAFS